MNIYLVIILFIIIGEYILDIIIEILNLRHAHPSVPDEFVGYYDESKYARSQEYLKENTSFKLIESTFFTCVLVVFIIAGGFNVVDQFARSFGCGPIVTGLIFAGVLLLLFQVLHIPFSAYHTFVIEEKYGFNKMTVKTFCLDIMKGFLLGAAIGAVAFSFVIWFFLTLGKWAWVYCWIGVTLFQLFLMFIAPVVILPIFNKFIPLEEGDLKTSIEHFAKEQHFALKGIFKMDASRRTTKSNAYFTGFGRFRRIALFDTLIDKHTPDELVSILAHEIGHYKKQHIIKTVTISIVTLAFMFYILSLFINNQQLFAAFSVGHVSIYASLFFFGFLYSPINMILSIFAHFLSRRYEYQADTFALLTQKRPGAFITALKKLSVENLSNLTPHPLKVFLEYSHPPVLQRIQRLRSLAETHGVIEI